ncbi:hypothetical protein HerbRD11066_30880 [Herbidospora sp. RD11066]
MPGGSGDRPGHPRSIPKGLPQVINHVRMTRLDDDLGLDAIAEQLSYVIRFSGPETDEKVEGLL